MLNPVTYIFFLLFTYKRTFDAFRVSAVRFTNYYYHTNVLRAFVQDLDIWIFSPQVAY